MCIFAMIIFWEVINIFRDFGSSFHFYIWNQLDILLFSDPESQLIKEKVYDNETFLFRCFFEIWKNTWSVLKIIYLYLLLDTLWLSFSFSIPCFIPTVGFLYWWHIYFYILICKENAKCRKVLSYRDNYFNIFGTE